MNTFQAIPALNELLAILCRSLPAYLAEARPWTSADDQQLRSSLDHLVADQRRYAQRVTATIVELGGQPDPGRFPLTLMAKNDLALEFLRQEVVFQHEQDVLAIEECAAELEGFSALHALAEEILGNARGHLDILREMTNVEIKMPKE